MLTRRMGLTAAALLGVIGLGIGVWLFWPESVPPAQEITKLQASADRGRYLALMGNCATCHTAKDGAPYAGGVKFHTEFGELYSTNITSDVATGIGAWSFDDFHRAMKHGVRPDGTHLYPAFPYPSFARMTDSDLASLFMYMKTVAPVKAAAKANDCELSP